MNSSFVRPKACAQSACVHLLSFPFVAIGDCDDIVFAIQNKRIFHYEVEGAIEGAIEGAVEGAVEGKVEGKVEEYTEIAWHCWLGDFYTTHILPLHHIATFLHVTPVTSCLISVGREPAPGQEWSVMLYFCVMCQ